jgi:hypothetical protein
MPVMTSALAARPPQPSWRARAVKTGASRLQHASLAQSATVVAGERYSA